MKCFWEELNKILLEEGKKLGVTLKIEDIEIGGNKLSVEELKKKYKVRVNKIKIKRENNINVEDVNIREKEDSKRVGGLGGC